MKTKESVFYKKHTNHDLVSTETLPGNYALELWTPGLFRIFPKGLRAKAFFARYILFFKKILLNQKSYEVFIVRDTHEAKIKHCSFVVSKCWKFAFMKASDFHVGPIWTDPSVRRQGIASFVLSEIIKKYAGDLCWIVVEDNYASIMLCEKFGFSKIGRVYRDWLGKWHSKPRES